MRHRIYVAGHTGMVGSAIIRHLIKQGYSDGEIITRSRAELDLLNQAEVRSYFETERPTQVFLAAARVGGIHANNTHPADFIYENIVIQSNVIETAFRSGVRKLLFLGSSCIYPKYAAQPIKEEALLTGALESTNEPYAIAKIAGIKLCESLNRQYGESHGLDYRCVMPTNLYGPGDRYHSEYSHVIPALIQRFHRAKTSNEPTVTIWGSGKARREFLHVDDMAAACVFVSNLSIAKFKESTNEMYSHLNIGYGEDISIIDLATAIARVVEYKGVITTDETKPEGPPKKQLDSGRINKLGWYPSISLLDGLRSTYQDYLNSVRNRNQ